MEDQERRGTPETLGNARDRWGRLGNLKNARKLLQSNKVPSGLFQSQKKPSGKKTLTRLGRVLGRLCDACRFVNGFFLEF